MAAWWVSTAIKAAPYIYSAFTSKSKGDRQSQLDANYALSNSSAIDQAGEANAKAILAMGALNAQSAIISSKAENEKIKALTEYNSQRSIMLGEYNAQLDEQEALLVLEEAELDLAQLRRQQERQIGEVKVSHGASGAIMGQDTSGAVIADAEQQAELEQFVVRRGADIQFGKLMDRSAQSRWQGYEEANKMIVEASIITNTNTINAGLGSTGIKAQSMIDASLERYNSKIKADQVFQSGMLSSNNNAYSGNSALWSNIFTAGTTIASSYLANKSDSDNMEGVTALLSES